MYCVNQLPQNSTHINLGRLELGNDLWLIFKYLKCTSLNKNVNSVSNSILWMKVGEADVVAWVDHEVSGPVRTELFVG